MYNDNIAIKEYNDYIAETWERCPAEDAIEIMYKDAIERGYITE